MGDVEWGCFDPWAVWSSVVSSGAAVGEVVLSRVILGCFEGGWSGL